jgi:hypothetical protein
MTCRHLVDQICRCPESRAFNVRLVGNICARCPQYDGPIRGFGDVVHAVTKVAGIKACGGCQQRRDALNRALPSQVGVVGVEVGDGSVPENPQGS